MVESLAFAKHEKLLKDVEGAPSNEQLIELGVQSQIKTGKFGLKMAAAVLIHTAFEQFLWNLCRLGFALKRDVCFEKIKRRKVSLEELVKESASSMLIDQGFELFWEELEKKSISSKWQECVAIFGYPKRMIEHPWHFDLALLEEFDSARHDAVHHNGSRLEKFDLENFKNQANRATLNWTFHVAKSCGIYLIPEEYGKGMTEQAST